MNRIDTWALRLLALACVAGGPVPCRGTDDPAPLAANPALTTNAPVPSVTRHSRRLEEDELRGLLTTALNQQRGDDGAEWELRFTRPWTPVTVPDGPLAVEILEPSPARMASTCILRFELRAGREIAGSWQVPVQAHFWREVLVAHAALQRGQFLNTADLTRERRDVITLRNPLCELPADAAAYELAESVPAGAPLYTRAVRPRPVVFRGQTADAIVRDGVMMISLKVEVLEAGVPGQVVRVRNLQSRRELRGKVQDEQTIAISL